MATTLVAVGIAGILVVTTPAHLSFILNQFQKASVTDVINEQLDLSPGRFESYEINVAGSRAIQLQVYANNPDAKFAIDVYHLHGQNKTFSGGQDRLKYIVDFDTPLNVEIIPEQDSTVVIELQPFSQSNVNVQISLRHVH